VRARVDPQIFDRLLLERGLNITDLARKSGISRTTLAKIRRGEAVRMQTMIRAAAALKRFSVHPEILALTA
jgi:predicted transcriptional regulator